MFNRKLCVPCREEYKKTRKVKMIGGKAEKATCFKCKRRRYCNTYSISLFGKDEDK